MNKLIVKKAAVLGAGVMGAQIAAHLANANVPVVLFDLPAKDGDKNEIVKKALDGLKKLDPAPLANKGKLKFIDAANYEEHLPLLAECDLAVSYTHLDVYKRQLQDQSLERMSPALQRAGKLFARRLRDPLLARDAFDLSLIHI